MGRLISSNYTAAGTQFQWADTDDEHPLFPEDLGRLAAAFDQHTHASTRGLAVARVADLSIHANAYQAGSIGTAKIQDGAITSAKLGNLAVNGQHFNGQVVNGASHIVPSSIVAANLAVLSGNPAVRLGPLGHASYGSIRWDGDGGAGTYLYDSLTGGSVSGRFIMQARTGEFHLLNSAGSGYGLMFLGGLDVQSGGAGITVRSSLQTASDAPVNLTGNSQLKIVRTPADNAGLTTNGGLLLESSVPCISFNRPGIEGAGLFLLGGSFLKKMSNGQNATIWDSNNDGAGSGMDADTVDGVQESALAKLAGANFSSLQVGGQTVATLNSANFGALQLNGQTVAVRDGSEQSNLNAAQLQGHPASYFAVAGSTQVVTGTYTGNGATNNRVISCGFQPKYVVLTGGSSNSDIEQITIHSTSGCSRATNGGNVTFQGACKLDPSGFLVGGGANFGNVNGVGYAWAAFQ